ncbi:MAG: carboxymuconolactone decarboxylase family protein [Rickettsiales bacterium]|nr:carboxymuconolactone decarboxylase family protein [Rickettsiales bacterium]
MSIQLATINDDASYTLEQYRDEIPDFAKDIRLNLGTVLTPEGAPELSEAQIYAIALASAYAAGQPKLIAALKNLSSGKIDDALLQAAKAAASIMAMNNIYYRFVHLSGDDELKKLPAKLRMNVIGSPGVNKIDFELMCLAVSAVNGCGMCIEAHNHELLKAGATKLALQSTARIAAVIHAAAKVHLIY